jgi:hypothetical protein
MERNSVLVSRYRPLCGVALPSPDKGRQFYMHALDAAAPSVPEGYDDYLAPVTALLRAAGAQGQAFLTVDEKVVQAGMSQRRPGPHVDGCFIPSLNRWGGWNHYCNHLPIPRMAVIVASSVSGCRAWAGDFVGEPRNDGDLSHLTLPEGEVLPANVGYLLSPDCIHESMRFDVDTPRTFIRIALATSANLKEPQSP